MREAIGALAWYGCGLGGMAAWFYLLTREWRWWTSLVIVLLTLFGLGIGLEWLGLPLPLPAERTD